MKTDGSQVIGDLVNGEVSFKEVNGESNALDWTKVLSLHSAASSSEYESNIINEWLPKLDGDDIAQTETASEHLANVGLPVIDPLLKSFVDTNAAEPNHRYRLFGRIIPGYADGFNRTLDMVRMENGKTARGDLSGSELTLELDSGDKQTIAFDEIRWAAVRQSEIRRELELQALDHCSYIGYMDTGIFVDSASKVEGVASGFARLSFDEDGWATGPEGIAEPLPGKRKLQEGFRWGCLLGRTGTTGERWYAGDKFAKSDIGTGRFYLVINDNEHWQNNIGSYRVVVEASNAFDIGDAR
ncbi:MAG: hypothetical protein R3C03_10860 [Pirellulaceae bacterium]